MPELNLGNKYECFSCSTRFYDLGKPEALCPKCGANQKDSNRAEASGTSQAARKRRKVEAAKPIAIEIEEEEPIEEIADDDIVVAADVELDDDAEEEEEDFDAEA